MNLGFLNNIPWFGINSNMDLRSTLKSAGSVMESSKQLAFFKIKIWGWSLLSIVPWAINSGDTRRMPHTVNRELQRRARPHGTLESGGGCYVPLFRPYVAKVPWHNGARAFLSQFFPRYGHYCGPNWSSGKDNGTLLWDQRPIDWLDFCCYCHDIGYDSHDQAKLLKADLAFLECLERPRMSTKGDARIAHLYKTMCITGLRNIIIPYRRQLVRIQTGESLIGFGWLGNVKWKS
ncbi:hypothetical protein HHK36_011750 [Tetracentron sinense]|uniref:Uncharacterized protein n=1 Tax=Tetracentron sinense TaxID=13715 RepID=A0A834ZC83_TETSI|nr:hypothetical protein HHK36_011750 [Tetracentron sinense]